MKKYECKGQLSIFDIEIPEKKTQLQDKSVSVVNSDKQVRQCSCSGAARIVRTGNGVYITCSKCQKSTPMGYDEGKVIAEWEELVKPRWKRLSLHTPPEDPDKVIKVMYTWMNGKRTGECAATYEDGKIHFIGLPWDIGKVEPEAWKETDYTREEYREKYGR